eukprot:scaffold33361_cov52-Phaeocystis_antarctica.AAC.1
MQCCASAHLQSQPVGCGGGGGGGGGGQWGGAEKLGISGLSVSVDAASASLALCRLSAMRAAASGPISASRTFSLCARFDSRLCTASSLVAFLAAFL